MPTRNLFSCVDARVLRRALASFILLTACGDDSNPTPGDDSTGTGDTEGDPSTSPSTTISTSTNPSTTNPSTTGETDTDGTSSTSGEESTTSSATADTETTTTGETESSTTSAEMCGNDIIEGAEECDGIDLGDQDCESLDFDGGELACDGSCGFDTSGCFTMTCGNDTLEGKEVCDGTELDGETCVTQDFDGGELACAKGCAAFDTSGCFNATCGNDTAEVGEACDGPDLAGETCSSLGAGTSGTLVCLDDCSGFDTTACVDEGCPEEDIGSAVGAAVASGSTVGEDENFAQVCAAGGAVDHVILWTAPADGMYRIDTDGSDYDTALALYTDCEVGTEYLCDDDDGTGAASNIYATFTAGETVIISVNGFNGVTGNWILNINAFDAAGDCCAAGAGLGCDDDPCTEQICNADPFCCQSSWDATCANNAVLTCETCFVPDICGNNVIDGMGEVCDGPDLAGETCETQGFDGGTLGCAMDCGTFDTTGCAVFEGDCCADNGANSPGCDDDVCTAAVCGADPFCCDTTWDPSCANQAIGLCGVCGGGVGDCCTETGDVGCEDAECVEIICGFGGLDSTCCTADWTSACTDLATANCPVCI